MIVYTDKEDKIVAYDTTDDTGLTAIEVYDFFDNKCDAFIYGYKCLLNYEYLTDDNGNIKHDMNGNPMYKTDENGNKIIIGYSLHPWKNYEQLEAFQFAYEQTILQVADILGGVYE